MNTTVIILIIWNTVITTLYGIDKLRARKGEWRISENALIFPAFLFGSTGAMLGMIIFNHKTSKIKFRICIPLSVIVNILTVYVFAVVIGR